MQYTDKLTVVLVEPPGDEAASVTLRSAKGKVVAFCWPCDLQVGDRIDNRLSTLEADARTSYFSDWPEDEKEALSTDWIERTGPHAYRGRGVSSIRHRGWSKSKGSSWKWTCQAAHTSISASSGLMWEDSFLD